MKRYPIKFAPQEKKAIWGREIWLVSGHPSMPSVAANGIYAGRKLPDLVADFGTELVGSASPVGKFPLLVKVIEANDRLSVQVHSCEESAKLCGGDPKTEMWYVLESGHGAEIFAGLRHGVDRERLEKALAGDAEQAVAKFRVKRGDVLFIPGGLVHAIGGGCRVFEVQQTSDTTWRLHDWNRVDAATGQPRKLNLREGFASIDWSLPPPELLRDTTIGDGGTSAQELVKCDFFRFSVRDLREPVLLEGSEESFVILHAEEGGGEVFVEGTEPVAFAAGECVLVPAATPFEIRPKPHAHLLVAEAGRRK